MNKILNKRAQAIIRAVVNDKRISALGEVKFQTDPVKGYRIPTNPQAR